MAKGGVSRKLGKGLAYVQSGLDDIVDFGFKKMREYGEDEKVKKKEDPSLKGKVFKGMKAVFGVLGNMGESFYDEYEKIKATKRDMKERGKE
ncbi:hypothetical protein GF354_03590 [Candidatus Peregrinibacteria bacterium]|nr:hypothetical protein [Candidatus Peregrinibacteria bacterium]